LSQFIVLGQTLSEIHSHDEEPDVWCGPVRDSKVAAIVAYRGLNRNWTQPQEGFDEALVALFKIAVGVPVKWEQNDVMLRVVEVPEVS
jgi:hypothetical protein